jgi:hypothetical protein
MQKLYNTLDEGKAGSKLLETKSFAVDPLGVLYGTFAVQECYIETT